MACVDRIRKSAQKDAQDDSAPAYVLRAGVDVYFGSTRVNAATLTDDLARAIIARGFDKSFFEKCE